MSFTEPEVPSLLQELVALEPYYEESSTIPQPCCTNRMTGEDNDKFDSLLHMVEHRLHQVVRWARRIPGFANFTKKDQVLLLMNSWAELICFGVIWRSRDAEGFVRLSYGKTIDMTKAREMNHAENIGRVIYVTSEFRKMEVDLYEYVAVKTLSLLLPDILDLHDRDSVQKYRDKLLEALQTYTTQRYPDFPLKFARLLVTVNEVQRLTALTRQRIVELPTSEISRNTLLSELLQHKEPFKPVQLTDYEKLGVTEKCSRKEGTVPGPTQSSRPEFCRSQSTSEDNSTLSCSKQIVA